MAVTHDFECEIHGQFEKRVKPGTIPKCPSGCSKTFVRLIFTKPPGHISGRTRTGDRLVREMADIQGLSDISTSPSRPGGSVADRNRMRGPQGREDLQYPDMASAKPIPMGKLLGAMTAKDNALSRVGFGHSYDPAEWKADDKTGKIKHVGAQGPKSIIPTGAAVTLSEQGELVAAPGPGVSIERVKGNPE